MEDLGRPETGHHVRDGSEPSCADALGDDRREIGTLGIPRARRFLDVREARAVLDVQQRGRLPRPRQHIGASGELVVLVGVVDGHHVAEALEMRCLELSHGRVDRVLARARWREGAPARYELQLDSQAKRCCQRGQHLDRAAHARLRRMCGRARHPAAHRELRQGPATSQARLADPLTRDRGDRVGTPPS